MNKLVRDKIPEIMKNKNQNPKTKIIKDDSEYLSALSKKFSNPPPEEVAL